MRTEIETAGSGKGRLTSHPTEGLLDAEGEPAAPRGLVKHFPDLVQLPAARTAPASGGGGGGGGGGLGGGGGGQRTPAAHSKQRTRLCTRGTPSRGACPSSTSPTKQPRGRRTTLRTAPAPPPLAPRQPPLAPPVLQPGRWPALQPGRRWWRWRWWRWWWRRRRPRSAAPRHARQPLRSPRAQPARWGAACSAPADRPHPRCPACDRESSSVERGGRRPRRTESRRCRGRLRTATIGQKSRQRWRSCAASPRAPP
eukprot:scaffold19408_cov57-Phaeocystis_antarctica.AAC.3